IVGEPVHGFIRRLRLEKAIFAMSHGPKSTLTAIALGAGFGSSSDFSKAFRQAYGFSPRQFTADRFHQDSKIRQDLLANAGYGFTRLPRGRNPDRFRVRLVDRSVTRVAYVRVTGGFDAGKIADAFERLIAWARPLGLVPSAGLIGMSQDDPEITPMS